MSEFLSLGALVALHITGRMRLPPIEGVEDDEWFPAIAARARAMVHAEAELGAIEAAGDGGEIRRARQAWEALFGQIDGKWWLALQQDGSQLLRHTMREGLPKGCQASRGATRSKLALSTNLSMGKASGGGMPRWQPRFD